MASFFLFISPWIFGFLFLLVLPLIWGFLMSMTNYTGFNIKNLKFIGFANYIRAFKDKNTLKGIYHTVYITCIGVPLRVVLGLGLALLLNQGLKAQGVFRTLFYIPYIVPVSSLVIIWQQIFSKSTGLINRMLRIPFKEIAVNWLLDFPNECLILLYIWGLGGGMVIYLAGLQGVPDELKDSARIDGANSFQVFRLVTLPLLTPVLFFQLITGIIWTLQLLVPALLLVPGGYDAEASFSKVPGPNRLFMVHLYEQTFQYQRFGYGLALSWILFVIILILSLFIVKTSKYWVYYEVEVEERRI